jgi:hypothetical protein
MRRAVMNNGGAKSIGNELCHFFPNVLAKPYFESSLQQVSAGERG